MKLPLFLPACVLAAASLATAQTPSSPPASKPGVEITMARETGAARTVRGLTVQAGRLEDAIADLEANAPTPLPTLVFEPGARDLKLAAPLRIKDDVRPVDALALIAAAAGGFLEPIYSPLPVAKGEEPAPIGYRVQLASRQTTVAPSGAANAKDASPAGAVGLTLANKEGAVVVEKILPGSPADPKVEPGDQIVAVGEELKSDVDIANMPIEKVAELIRGTPGSLVRLTLRSAKAAGAPDRTVLLKRAVLKYPEPIPAVPQVGVLNNSSTLSYSLLLDSNKAQPPAGPKAAKTSEVSIVRIYALGAILGSSEVEIKEKETVFEGLLAEAFDRAGLREDHSTEARGAKASQKPASLSFHTKARVLIATATPKEHEIIEQVIKALKENESADSTQKRR